VFKNVLILVFIFSYSFSCAQNNDSIQKFIKGEVPNTIKNEDTIFFTNIFYIDNKYFSTNNIASIINNNKFEIKVNLNYPHMFKMSFKSERNKFLFRDGDYYIDQFTSFIKIDSTGECDIVFGKTHKEYKNKFIPFFLTDSTYDCKSNSLAKFRSQYGDDFDTKLLEYTSNNPDSFVALWNLIERFSLNGYSKIYEEIFYTFSNKMKSERLWKILSVDFKSIKIKENELFPELNLKNTNLNSKKLKLTSAKYTLIDFWFSSCKPCLKAFPQLKKIYQMYHYKGFEIIGISTDKTKYIKNWLEKIKSEEINWIHYLDENGVEATRDRIISFPTTFLLDKNGKVIYKNITLLELEKFLKKNLNQ